MATPTKVIVIGAGWSGLVTARTYLHVSELLDRPVELTVLDQSNDPGGVWSTSHLYPGLIANSPIGLYEYSHMTMATDEHPQFQPLPGEVVQNYLEAYARKFDIYPRIRFNTTVISARSRGSGINTGWIIQTDKGDVLECDKLLVASGLYSNPRIPAIPNSTYTGISVHQRDLGSRQQSIWTDPSIKSIVVVGGCKSAMEACNVFLPNKNSQQRHRISWVIRPTEQGAAIIVQDVEQTANLVAAAQSRIFATISPSIHSTTSFSYRFLHSGKNVLGSFLFGLIWRLLSWAMVRGAKLDSSKNGRKVKPQGTSLFYDSSNISLLPKDSRFLEWLHADDDSVLSVHRGAAIQLEDRQMVLRLEDGSTTRIPCDAVIWATGWLPSMDFFSGEQKSSLGIPVLTPGTASTQQSKTEKSLASIPSSPAPASTFAPRSALAEKAEQQVLTLFPALRAPARPAYPPPYSPYRLYRHVIPLSAFPSRSDPSKAMYDRSLSFPGLISNAQTAICSELTALYTVAFMEDLIPPDSLPKSREEAEEQVELALAFSRRRYGVKGGRDPEVVLEVQSFLDRICKDLGVGVWRKRMTLGLEVGSVGGWERDEQEQQQQHQPSIAQQGGLSGWLRNLKGWFVEYFTPYFATDYRGIVEEFVETYAFRMIRESLPGEGAEIEAMARAMARGGN